MKKEDLKWYWICSPCAIERGGKFPEGHICTVTHDKCMYCGKTNVVIPIFDFDWDFWKTEGLRD